MRERDAAARPDRPQPPSASRSWAAPRPRKRRGARGLVLLLVCSAIVISFALALSVGLLFLLRHRHRPSSDSPSPSGTPPTPATPPPTAPNMGGLLTQLRQPKRSNAQPAPVKARLRGAWGEHRGATAVPVLLPPSAHFLGPEHGNDPPLPRADGLRADAVSFVLCTWTGDKEGFPRVPMLVASLRKFAAPGLIDAMYFVTPERDGDHLRSLAAKGFDVQPPPSFPLKVLHDEDVLTHNKSTFAALLPDGERASVGGRGVNYRMQMLLKLGVARHVQTTFYVTLDDDVFMKRPVSLSDLLPGGRGIVQGREGNRHRSSWWDSGGSIVRNSERCGRDLGSLRTQIGVTPALLSTALARELLTYLEDSYPGDGGAKEGWDMVMFHNLHRPGVNDWTEYTLYWSYGCRRRVLGRLHTRAPRSKMYDASAFDWNSFGRYNVTKVFADNSTLFGVVQSINGAPSSDVIAALSPRFQP